MQENEIKKVFTKNLGTLLEKKKIQQNELAKYMNVSNTTINNWVKGYKMPRMDKIDKICLYLNVKRHELLEEISPLPSHAEHAKGVRIPILGKVVAGVPIEAIEEIEGWEEIKPELAATGKFFALKVRGRSMEPQLLEGDVVIIKQVEEVNDGDIAIVLVNGYEATVKKIKIQDTGLTLIGLNVDVYPPHFYCAEEVTNLPVKIIGKVVELRRTLGSSGY